MEVIGPLLIGGTVEGFPFEDIVPFTIGGPEYGLLGVVVDLEGCVVLGGVGGRVTVFLTIRGAGPIALEKLWVIQSNSLMLIFCLFGRLIFTTCFPTKGGGLRLNVSTTPM